MSNCPNCTERERIAEARLSEIKTLRKSLNESRWPVTIFLDIIAPDGVVIMSKAMIFIHGDNKLSECKNAAALFAENKGFKLSDVVYKAYIMHSGEFYQILI